MKPLINLCIICLLISLGCNPAARELRKDSNAVTRVLKKDSLLNVTGKVWERSHPCINDTITHDSIVVKDKQVPVYIPLKNYYAKTNDGIEISIVDSQLRIDVPADYNVKFRDHYIADTRKLGLCRDSVIAYIDSMQGKKGEIVFMNGMLKACGDQLGISKKALEDANTYYKKQRDNPGANFRYLCSSLVDKWYFWMIVVGGGLFFTRRFWLKFI